MAYDHIAEGQWGTVTAGADSPYRRVRARLLYQQHGGHIHAWGKFQVPGGRVLMVHASSDIAEMERGIDAELRRRLSLEMRQKFGNRASAGDDAVSGGWFRRRMRKLKNKIKKWAKKSTIVKVLKTVHKTVEKALDNPLVQAALASNPYGAAFLAARKATKMAFHAIKGSVKAKGHLGQLFKMAKTGNLKAKNILRFMKKQVKLNPKMFSKAKGYASMVKTSGDEMADLAAFVQGCSMEPSTSAGNYEIMGDYYSILGDDSTNEPTDDELDAVEHFATSGSFEGVRWLAGRLSLHSMNNHPDELSTRQALTTGRSAQAARFAH